MTILARKNPPDMAHIARHTLLALFAALLHAFPSTAHADDWGCTVLLCLADPRGPESEQQCVPPIERLKHGLANGDGMPSCNMGSQGNGTYATQVYSPFNPCTSPLNSAPPNSYIAQGPLSRREEEFGTFKYALSDGQTAFACVGNAVGKTTVEINRNGENDRSDENLVTVNLYDQVVWQVPQSPNAIDVYISGKFWQRYHW